MQLSDDESQKKLSKQEGPSVSPGPLALPQRVTETAAVGPGVKGGHGRGHSDLLSPFLKKRMESWMNVANYHDACHLKIA